MEQLFEEPSDETSRLCESAEEQLWPVNISTRSKLYNSIKPKKINRMPALKVLIPGNFNIKDFLAKYPLQFEQFKEDHHAKPFP